MSETARNIEQSTSTEKLELLEEIWDSLARTPDAVPLTTAQRQELDRRLDELDRDGPVGVPWEKVVVACMHGRRDPLRWRSRR